MAIWFNDTATEASTTPLTSHTTDSGHTWVYGAGDASSSPLVYASFGGVIAAGAATPQIYRSSVIAPQAGVIVSSLTKFGNLSLNRVGVGARLDASCTTGYLALYSQTNTRWEIYRLGSALALTSITNSATIAYAAGDAPALAFSVTGSGATVTLELVVDGVLVANGNDTSGSRITTAGYVGVWFDCTAGGGLYFNDISANTVGTSWSATFTSPASGKVNQLSGGATGTASISMGGSYGGAAPDQWRLVQDGTNTPVSGFDWAAFTTAPAAGFFNQTITGVPKQAGWLNVQVQDSTTAGSVATSGKTGTGVLVVVDGQSSAWLWFSPTAYAGDNTLTPSPLLRITGIQSAGAWIAPDTATMNGAIACGNSLVAVCGCPVALIDGSWNGSSLTYSTNGGQWISGGAAGNAYTASAAAVAAAGNQAVATVWVQGEGDVSASVSQSAYYTALGQLIALRRAALSSSANPYVVVTIGRPAGTTDAQVQPIKLAQVQKCADTGVYRVDRQDLPLHTDGLHHTAAGYKSMGERVARAILYSLGLVATYRGPRIASVTATATSAVFDVLLTHDMGTDFTPSSAITGFRVLDSGSPATISSVVRQSASVIRITLVTAPSGLPTVQYLYGALPDVSAVIKDNGALNLPLEYNNGVPELASRTLAPGGQATALKVSATRWRINGVRLT